MKNEKSFPKGDPMKCVWMTAGVVDFKLCNLEFDCEHCTFDQAIRGRTSPGEELSNEQGFRLDTASFYDDAHIWLRIEEQGRVRIGLDDFAQHLTGRIYSVRLPECGSIVDPERSCWSITHVHGDTALQSGLRGKVLRINQRLQNSPSLINNDPYGAGWAFVLEPENLREGLRTLRYGVRVRQWVGEETQRLRAALDDATTESPITLQDGGSLVEDLSNQLNADIIQDFLSGHRVRSNHERR